MSTTGYGSQKITLTQRELCRFRPSVFPSSRSGFPPSEVHQRKPRKRFIHSLMTIATIRSGRSRVESITTVATASTLSNQSTIRKHRRRVRSSFPTLMRHILKSLPNGQTPDTLIVAKESSALRSIFPLVDHQQHVEAIIDPGSQIIAIAEEVVST